LHHWCLIHFDIKILIIKLSNAVF